jgi:isopentenyldiphosphate isomerase
MEGNVKPETILNTTNSLPYQVKFVQYRYVNRSETPVVNVELDAISSYTVSRNKNIYGQRPNYNSRRVEKVEDLVFIVKPDVQNDVYELYTYGDGIKDVFHGYAGIQSYEASVMMNKLFRKIKENDNLDALEESDDEEDFENVDEYKYVKMNTTYRMVCKYMHRINKWLPQKLAHRSQRVATLEKTSGLGKTEK